MLSLQNWISSFRSDGVVDVLGIGGGATRGETWPGGKTSCRVGGTAAARTTVNCSGETRFATSAKPFAAAAEYRWASARLEKTSDANSLKPVFFSSYAGCCLHCFLVLLFLRVGSLRLFWGMFVRGCARIDLC